MLVYILEIIKWHASSTKGKVVGSYNYIKLLEDFYLKLNSLFKPNIKMDNMF